MHTPGGWQEELAWMINHGSGKGWKAMLLRSAITETVYEAWNYRNKRNFGIHVNNNDIGKLVIDNLVYRGWCIPKIRKKLVELMV